MCFPGAPSLMACRCSSTNKSSARKACNTQSPTGVNKADSSAGEANSKKTMMLTRLQVAATLAVKWLAKAAGNGVSMRSMYACANRPSSPFAQRATAVTSPPACKSTTAPACPAPAAPAPSAARCRGSGRLFTAGGASGEGGRRAGNGEGGSDCRPHPLILQAAAFQFLEALFLLSDFQFPAFLAF